MKWDELISDDTSRSVPELCSPGKGFSRHQQNSPEKQPWVLDAGVRGRDGLGERPDPFPFLPAEVSPPTSGEAGLGPTSVRQALGGQRDYWGQTCKSLTRTKLPLHPY